MKEKGNNMFKDLEFEQELEALLNKYSRENGSDTPDWILAAYLQTCLSLFDATVNARKAWYQSDQEPNKNLEDILAKYKGTKITITEDIKQNADYWANIKTTESKNIPGYMHKTEKEIYADFYQGFLGEFSVQAIFEIPLSLVHYFSKNSGDEGVDHTAKLFDNLIIDTKTTTALNTYGVMVPISKIYPKTDIYFVMNLEGDEIEFKGYLWKKDVEENHIHYPISGGFLPGVKKEYIR